MLKQDIFNSEFLLAFNALEIEAESREKRWSHVTADSSATLCQIRNSC